MAAFNKFNPFIEAVFEKQHNFSSDVFKVMLTNVAPTAANGVKADITEIAAGNGYTAGGQAVTILTSSQTGGTYTATVNQTVTWTAAGGSIASLRYAVMYNDTAASKNLVGYWDYGSSVAPASGETFQWIMNANLISAS
jgi:hypothetical protein